MRALSNSALLGFFLIWFCSCSKNSVYSIAGRWSVVNDTSWVDLGAANYQVPYSGHFGDYYYFDADSLLYTNINTVLDTFTYKILSPTTILLNRLSDLRAGDTVISPSDLQLTSGRARIDGPYLYTYADFGMVVNLAR
jgi:hypothetical protein